MGVGGVAAKKTFRGRGLDIFWNNSRPWHPQIYLPPSELRLWCCKFVSHRSLGTNASHKDIFFKWHHDLFVLHDVHSQHVYLQEEKLWGVMNLKSHSKFVLIMFYLLLINSGHADSSVADKNPGKVYSWKVMLWMNITYPHKKNALAWCILMYYIIGLKQSRGIKNVALKLGQKNLLVSWSNLKSNILYHFSHVKNYL